MSTTSVRNVYDRVFNFSAGPCTLPVSVLEQARDELMNWNGVGASLMEVSHRSKEFEACLEQTISDLRTLLGIPDNYKILFLQGGASLQFTMVSTNFRTPEQSADYIVTGTWGQKAYEAANMQGYKANLLYSGKSTNYNHVPKLSEQRQSAESAFVHYTSNETVHGVEFFEDPTRIAGETWICDMSSDILSRPVDVTKYDMIYAGAQKNMGPAGSTVAIISDEMLARVPSGLPPMLDYRLQAENGSMYNTPPCWSIYICGLVYKWLLANGGLKAMHETNLKKAAALYSAIDECPIFTGHAEESCRSIMNVTFTLPSDELTAKFLTGAKANGMVELKGHRSVGGCRASIYNAMPLEGCVALGQYMRDFASQNG